MELSALVSASSSPTVPPPAPTPPSSSEIAIWDSSGKVKLKRTNLECYTCHTLKPKADNQTKSLPRVTSTNDFEGKVAKLWIWTTQEVIQEILGWSIMLRCRNPFPITSLSFILRDLDIYKSVVPVNYFRVYMASTWRSQIVPFSLLFLLIQHWNRWTSMCAILSRDLGHQKGGRWGKSEVCARAQCLGNFIHVSRTTQGLKNNTKFNLLLISNFFNLNKESRELPFVGEEKIETPRKLSRTPRSYQSSRRISSQPMILYDLSKIRAFLMASQQLKVNNRLSKWICHETSLI